MRTAEELEAHRELGESQRYERYRELRSAGESHSIALMLAARQAPGTDRTDERWQGQKDPEAHARGLKMTGKYQPGLARYPGDPRAIVSSRAEARKVAERAGWTITDRPANADDSVQRRRMAERKALEEVS